MSSGAAASVSLSIYPKVLITDLDWTIWPMDVDTDVRVPFSRSGGRVIDKHGTECSLYPEIREVFKDCTAKNMLIAFASRTTDGEAAKELLLAHGLFDYLKGNRGLFQAYPSGGFGGKRRHFEAILAASGYTASDCIFFDDLNENIVGAEKMGMVSELVGSEGLNLAVYKKCIERWQEKPSSDGTSGGRPTS